MEQGLINAPPVFLTLWDHDTKLGIFAGESDLLGTCKYQVRELSDNLDERKINPTWISIKYNSVKAGEILCDFSFVKHRKKYPTKTDIKLHQKLKFVMRMNILGMRDLISLGILPVKRAFIKIDLNMFKSKDEGKGKKRVFKTIPKESGSDPNIGTVVW